MTYAIILAGGVGTRIGSAVAKQHIVVEKHQIIEYTLFAFSNCPDIDEIFVVSHPDYVSEMEKFKEKYKKLKRIISGGKTRIRSVLNAVKDIEEFCYDTDKIIISDADRPCITKRELSELIKSLDYHMASTTGIDNYETLFKIENEKIKSYIPRDGLVRQTSPEGYQFSVLKWLYIDASEKIIDSYRNIGIDQLFASGIDVGIVKSNSLNFKITRPEDIMLFENVIKNGFDKIING